ncbi:hypothetical protein PENSTE_c038G00241 [Penicillium steckii]|uniref:Uncharacterized protein n=1 Tax=Penicillium steckii TaxID=303698 RepID=A0A1V6SK32_9EURO|nr:hypothetical protein PENSTE_c038G00241 [Penicillium steckii]
MKKKNCGKKCGLDAEYYNS